MPRVTIGPALPDQKRLASRSRVCAISTSGSFAAVGIPCSGGPHPVTFRAIFFFALFEAVQTKLTEQTNNHKATRTNSEALLTGRISMIAAIA